MAQGTDNDGNMIQTRYGCVNLGHAAVPVREMAELYKDNDLYGSLPEFCEIHTIFYFNCVCPACKWEEIAVRTQVTNQQMRETERKLNHEIQVLKGEV